MIDRVEVEWLLHEIEHSCNVHQIQPHDITFDIEGDILKELCLSWILRDGGHESSHN